MNLGSVLWVTWSCAEPMQDSKQGGMRAFTVYFSGRLDHACWVLLCLQVSLCWQPCARCQACFPADWHPTAEQTH